MLVLPNEYGFTSEASGDEEEAMCEESTSQKPLCYYVMNNGVVEEQHAMFEKPTSDMMYHLKTLFIKDKVDSFPVNKMFVGGGADVNLRPQSLLKKIGKFDTNLKPYNMVLSNYEGKVSYILGVIQVNLSVSST